jgi:hypothetical protein
LELRSPPTGSWSGQCSCTPDTTWPLIRRLRHEAAERGCRRRARPFVPSFPFSRPWGMQYCHSVPFATSSGRTPAASGDSCGLPPTSWHPLFTQLPIREILPSWTSALRNLPKFAHLRYAQRIECRIWPTISSRSPNQGLHRAFSPPPEVVGNPYEGETTQGQS